MASWLIYVHTSVPGTTSGGYNRGTVSVTAGARAIYFGGSARAWYAISIRVNNYNKAMHISSAATAGALDLCATPHGQNLEYPAGTPTGFYWNADGIDTISINDPSPCAGIHCHFNHGAAVICNPTYIWAGTTDGVAETDPVDCSVIAFEIATTKAGNEWATIPYGNKLALKNSGSGTDMHWYIGLSVTPKDVGFNDDNEIRIETTYQ